MSNLKRISVISVMFFIAILITTISFAKTGTVNVEEVIVREGPSTTTNVVTGIKGNTEVEILGEEQGFYKIKYNETTGYIRSDLLNVKEEVVENEQAPVEENNIETEKNETVQEENVVAESTTDNVEIKEEETKEFPKEITLTTNVNVYILPIYTSTIITTIENGNNITINREVNNWSYITSGNITGWVRNYNLNNPTDIVADEEQQEEQQEQEKVENEQQEQTANIDIGYVNVSSVNVRKEANTNCDILTTLTRNTEVKVLAVEGEWYKVKYGDILGYIKQEFVSESQTETTSRAEEERTTTTVETKTGYISVSLANIREKASANSKVIKTLKKKTKVQVAGTEGEFTKIILDDGNTAYVATRLIVYNLDEIEEEPQSTNTASSNNVTVKPGNSSGQGIVDFANQFLGYSYVYGGTTPNSGFDCSGFTYYVFNQCGYNLSRSCSVQANSGAAVSKSELQAGDLIFFNNGSNGSIGHVGIYIGNGRFIHASNPTRGVVTDTINSGYYCTYYYSARRVAN